MRVHFGRVLASAVLLGTLAAFPGAGPARAEDPAGSARRVVEETVTELLEILAQKDWAVEKRVSEIEALAYRRFDFETISRLVLARAYRKFSEEQRVEFVEQFKLHLSRSYGNRVDRYDQQTVRFLGERVEKRGDVTVRTRIVGGQADGIDMNYRLRERDGDWLVIDVVIEGVSLVANYRSQFKELMSQRGPAGLIEQLREKNRSRDTSAAG